MKKINVLLFLIGVSLTGFLFTSCEKDTNMIVRNWTLQSKTIAGVDVATACERNSTWNFKNDGTYAIYDSCDKTKTGTWKLAEDEQTLTMDNVSVYQVNKNSVTELIIEMEVGGVNLVVWSFK